MELAVVGCNHRTAPMILRERLMLAASDRQRGPSWIDEDEAAAIMLLATCNRFEVYIAAPDRAEEMVDAVMQAIASIADIASAELAGCTYQYRANLAIDHLVRVSAGLESMVPGDPGILEQVRRCAAAIQPGLGSNAAAYFLTRVANRACSEAGRLRDRSAHPACAGGLASLAISLAKRQLGDWHERTIAIIGAGTVGKTAVEHLAIDRPGCLLLTNRSHRHGVRLARRSRATPLRFESRANFLADADAIISCTGSPDYVLTAEQFSPPIRERRKTPLLIIDLAVPRDIDPDLAMHDGIELFNVDDLYNNSLGNRDQDQPDQSRVARTQASTIESNSWSSMVRKSKRTA